MAAVCILFAAQVTLANGAYPRRIVEVSRTNSHYANDGSSYASISRDGRYVAFQSKATNLAGGGSSSDVFWRDLRTGVVELVSGAGGSAPDGFSGSPAISESGRFVVYSSVASNLVSGDTNGSYDVFRWDHDTRETALVSGVPLGDGDSHSPAISSSGRYIAFVSAAANLVASDTAGFEDVFVRDMQTGRTKRVSMGMGGTEAAGDSSSASISASGRYVAYCSRATNIVAGDTNNATDVFVFDTEAGTTRRVSISTGGVQGNLGSFSAMISGDGRRVVFESRSSNLVSGDTNDVRDVFVRDLAAATTKRVSGTAKGQSTAESREPSISYDGTKVAFTSEGALVSKDTNHVSDLYLRNLTTSSLRRLSVGVRSKQATKGCSGGQISGDGFNAVFLTAAALTSRDTNGVADVERVSFGRRPFERIGAGSASITSVLASGRAGTRVSRGAVIVNSANWYEMLCASSLCGATDSPMLLVTRTAVSPDVAAELARLGATRVWVIGGPSSVSTPVLDALQDAVPAAEFTRIAGTNRYRTSEKVAEVAVKLAGARWDHTVLVATGARYSGAVSGAAIAAATARPFVLVNSETGYYRLPVGTKRAVILGTTSQVSPSVSRSLVSKLGKGKVRRIGSANSNVMAASVALYATRSCKMTYDRLAVANLSRRAESICGAVLAGRCGSIVLGTSARSLPESTRTRLVSAATVVDHVRIIGTTNSVSTRTARAIRKALGG